MGVGSASERRRYYAMPSFIGEDQTRNDPRGTFSEDINAF